MLYYSSYYDRLGILITDYDERGHMYKYLEIEAEGEFLIPFTQDRWIFVGAL